MRKTIISIAAAAGMLASSSAWADFTVVCNEISARMVKATHGTAVLGSYKYTITAPYRNSNGNTARSGIEITCAETRQDVNVMIDRFGGPPDAGKIDNKLIDSLVTGERPHIDDQLTALPPDAWIHLAALAGHILTGDDQNALEKAIARGIYAAAYTKGTGLASNANPLQDDDCQYDMDLAKAHVTVRVINKTAHGLTHVDVRFSSKDPGPEMPVEPESGYCAVPGDLDGLGVRLKPTKAQGKLE